jgi:hypothetical protein
LVNLLIILIKIFNFNKNLEIKTIKRLNGKQLSSFLLYSIVIFSNNSLASSWIPKSSLLVKSFDFYDNQIDSSENKYSKSIFIEERIPNTQCSIGMNLFSISGGESKLSQQTGIENHSSFFYKCNISVKKNKLITIHLPISTTRHNKKSELMYGIAISNGSSNVIKKKIKNKLRPMTIFSDWRCDFIFSSNKSKKNIYKIQKTTGFSFKTIEFISIGTIEEYSYKNIFNTTKINSARTDVKIGIKLDSSLGLYFGLFKIFHFEKSETHKSMKDSSGFGFSFIMLG